MQPHGNQGAEDARGHLHDAAHEGQEGPAAALHGIAVDEDHAEGDEKDGCFHCVDPGPGHEGFHFRGRGKEEPHEDGEENDDGRPRDDGVDRFDPDGGPDALPDPGQVFFAEVLSAEGGHGLAHGDHALGQDVLQAPGGDKAGDGHGAEEVDRGLHDDGADRRDRELESHGNAHAELVRGGLPVKAPVIAAREQDRHEEQDVDEAEKGGDCLGQDRRQGGSVNPHPEADDEKGIQKNVESRGEDQEKEGSPAVAHRPQKRGEQVVEHGGGKPPADDHHVFLRVREDIRGRVHGDQEPGDQHEAGQGQKGGKDHGEHDAAGDTDPDSVPVAGAEALGCQNGEAGGQPHGKSEQQKRDRACRPDSSKCRGAKITAHNDGVRHIIELLKNISDKKGKGKTQDDGQDVSLGHILMHGISLLFIPSVSQTDRDGDVSDKFSFPEIKIVRMCDGGELKGVLELDLDPGPGLLDGAVESLVERIALGEALVQVREVAAVAAVVFFTKYCRVDELHGGVLS